MVIVGFTGTSDGLTRRQHESLIGVFELLNPTEFHHGDCFGADTQSHEVALKFRNHIKIVIHPPIDPKARTFCQTREGDVILDKKEYLDRNHDIVDACSVLIATPGTMGEVLRSGTWATVRYARKQKRTLHIVFPDGSVQIEPGSVHLST